MKIGRLKEIIKDMDDNMEFFVRNSKNPTGNISELQQVEESSYGFFGESIPCLILNTHHNMEVYQSQAYLNDEIDEDDIPDFLPKKQI